jgi:proline iminopeptidase
MQDDNYTIKSGYVDVGHGHKLYYQEWGDPSAEPIFFLHGGPGGGCNDSHKWYFDPTRQRVIFHDQRGSGKSTPFGSINNNTTEDLVDDINKLRAHLDIDTPHHFFGGSWGSCLALVYAIRNPEKVNKMLLRGIYTGSPYETNYIQQEGGISRYTPETWQRYIEIVPKERRDDTVKYYYEMMQSDDRVLADNHIRRWSQNEIAGLAVDSDVHALLHDSSPITDEMRSVSLLEAHYFVNNCFLEDNYVLTHASKLAGKEVVIVQGRHDHVCPPETAYALSNIVGPTCRLQIVPGGHTGSEATMREVLRAYAYYL